MYNNPFASYKTPSKAYSKLLNTSSNFIFHHLFTYHIPRSLQSHLQHGLWSLHYFMWFYLLNISTLKYCACLYNVNMFVPNINHKNIPPVILQDFQNLLRYIRSLIISTIYMLEMQQVIKQGTSLQLCIQFLPVLSSQFYASSPVCAAFRLLRTTLGGRVPNQFNQYM